jgi:hypothetical protein
MKTRVDTTASYATQPLSDLAKGLNALASGRAAARWAPATLDCAAQLIGQAVLIPPACQVGAGLFLQSVNPNATSRHPISMKPISAKPHGYLDYVTVLLFLSSPTMIGLTGAAAAIAYSLAMIHLLMTLITDFPLGAAGVLPFPLHGWVERIVGPVLIVLPFAIGFDAPARIFYVVMGIVIVLVGMLSDYRGTSR